MHLEDYNPHWRKGYFYGHEKKREIYGELWKSAEKRRITVITGTRRVGKTTIMKQIINDLIKNEVARYNILYFSFDESQPSIRDVIKEYEEKLGKDVSLSGEKYYVFFDEVQKLDNWHEQIKYFYDFYENIKFFVSGSASLFIKKGVRESLAGRVKEFYMGGLSFREYLIFTDKEYMLEKPEMFEDTLKSEFSRYLKRQYIEIVSEDEEEIRDYVRSIVEKVIYIDIPYIFSVKNPHLLMKIAGIVASSPGMLVDYTSISRAIGGGESISRVRVSNYIHYLEEAYLLKLGYNYSRSEMVSERKLKKAYLSNPSLSMMAQKAPDLGKLAEQTFFNRPEIRFFWRTPQKDEVDIVLETEDGVLPVEVKYQEEITKKDMKPLIKFMKKYNSKRGLIITKTTDGNVETEYGRIELIPAWKLEAKKMCYFGRPE